VQLCLAVVAQTMGIGMDIAQGGLAYQLASLGQLRAGETVLRQCMPEPLALYAPPPFEQLG